MLEREIQSLVQLELSKFGSVTFRNNVAQAWVGQLVDRTQSGTIVLSNARPLHAGLCKGSSDLIGWTSITIGAEHIGRQFAVFTACEVKTPRGVVTGEQENFLAVVDSAGGIAILARRPDDVERGVKEWIHRSP